MYRAHKANIQAIEDCTKSGALANAQKMEALFNKFDKKNKGYLDVSDFDELLSQLFSHNGQPHSLDSDLRRELFAASDIDGTGKISKEAFEKSWQSWISNVLNPVSALLVVDVQNDFISGTLSLSHCPAKQNGEEVVPIINTILEEVKFDMVVYSQDWHPADHISFFENVRTRKLHSSSKIGHDEAKTFDEVIFDSEPGPMSQVLWPAHCVQKSHGAELHKDLKILDDHVIVQKGKNPEVDSYSAFWDNGRLAQTDLDQHLRARGVTDVYVCGLAHDVCVAFTARDSVESGYRTVFIEDACRGVSQEGMQQTRRELTDKNVLFVNSDQVSDLVTAKNRPPTLAKVSLKNFQESLKDAQAK